MPESMRRPKVLVLTPRYPYPVIGGDRLRIYQICKALSVHCDLTLLSLCESTEELLSPLPADGVFNRVERILLPRWQSLLGVALSLPGRRPLQVAYYQCKAFKVRVDALIDEHDAGVAHLIRTGHYVRHASIPFFLEMTDAISLNYQRVRELGTKRDWRAWVYALEARRLLAYERRTHRKFEGAALVSEVDRRFLLQGSSDDRLIVCSNGVDTDEMPYTERGSAQQPIIVFIGHMGTVQNLDACTYFIESVLPRLRRHRPFRLRIVGRIDDATAKRLQSYDGVEVRGNVSSIPPEVQDAYAAVAPMRLGAGVQNKVLEYMALGLPVVTSVVGLEGLEAIPDQDILVAKEPESWERALTLLWDDTRLRIELARNARHYVEAHHSWSTQLAPLVERVVSMARRQFHL